MKPKDFDTVGHQGGDYGYSAEPTPSPYASGLGSDHAAGFGINESESKIPQGILAPKYDTPDESSYDQKPTVTDEGKDALAGALGYAEKPEDDSSRGSMFKSSDDYGNRAYDSARDTKDTVADKANEGYERTKDAFTPNSGSDYPDVAGSATESAYQAKDNVKDKAADLNNATDDSETYTEKAANTAYAVKDKAADTLGLNQPSEGPTVTEKVKDTLGMNQSSEGPSVIDQAKGYLGSAVDTTKDQAYRAKDAAAGYAGATTDTTKDYSGSAADTTKDYTGK